MNIILTFIFLLSSPVSDIGISTNNKEIFLNDHSLNDLNIKALEVLELKCNPCHILENKGSVFTMDNMEKSAKRIYKQVFVTQKMPKGDMVILTDTEKQILLDWLNPLLLKE